MIMFLTTLNQFQKSIVTIFQHFICFEAFDEVMEQYFKPVNSCSTLKTLWRKLVVLVFNLFILASACFSNLIFFNGNVYDWGTLLLSCLMSYGYRLLDTCNMYGNIWYFLILSMSRFMAGRSFIHSLGTLYLGR